MSVIRIQWRTGPSPLHGTGRFAATDLLAGEQLSLGTGHDGGCNSSMTPNVLVRCPHPRCELVRVVLAQRTAWLAFAAVPNEQTRRAFLESPSWAMAKCEGEMGLFALRDIPSGEELTCWDREYAEEMGRAITLQGSSRSRVRAQRTKE